VNVWAQSPLAGELPPGLALSTDGVISGAPQGAGSYSFQVAVEDSAGTIQTSNFYTIETPATGPLLIASKSLPEGAIGDFYNTNLLAAGGTTPYSHDPNGKPPGVAGWVILDTQRAPLSATDPGLDLGAVPPPGLTLDIGGKLSGMPMQRGTYSLSIQLTDSSTPPQVATGTVSLVIITMDQAILLGGLRFQEPTVPEAALGEAYLQQFQTNASDPTLVTYQLVDGDGHNSAEARASLPPGLVLSVDGLLSGVPIARGDFVFNVQASDEGLLTTTQQYELKVVGPYATGGGCDGLPNSGCSSMPGERPVSSTIVVLGLLAVSLRMRRRA
jgi:hypothetical protein